MSAKCERYTLKQLWQNIAKKKTSFINKKKISGPIGPLFREVAEQQIFLTMTEKMWAYVKELIIKSSEILCHKIESDIILHLIDINENSILHQCSLVTAKLLLLPLYSPKKYRVMSVL